MAKGSKLLQLCLDNLSCFPLLIMLLAQKNYCLSKLISFILVLSLFFLMQLFSFKIFIATEV